MASAGRILIVDDNAFLLEMVGSYVSRLGYETDICRNGGEAWDLVQANPAIYTGALIDLQMPGMNGEELARRILDSNASIRLVLMSGYPAEQSGIASLDAGRVTFLFKPFVPQELMAALAAFST